MDVVLTTGCSSGSDPGSPRGSAWAGDTACASTPTPSEPGALRVAGEAAGAEVEVVRLDATDDAPVKEAGC